MVEEPFLPEPGGDDPANGQAANKGTQNRENNPPTDEQSGIGESSFFAIVVGACNIGFAWIFSALSDHFDAHGFSNAAIVCRCCECLIFLLLVAVLVMKAWPHPRIVWPLFAGGSIAIILVFVFSSQPILLPKPPRPHFKFVLNTSDSPDARLQLTNAFFKCIPVSVAGTDLLKLHTKGDLVVPIRSVEHIPTLDFTIVNDSSVAADPVMVSFVADEGIDFIAPGWSGFTREHDAALKRRSIAIITGPIFPGNGEDLPAIQLENCSAISNKSPKICILQIIPKDRSDSFTVFWLALPVTTNLTRPRVVLAETNGMVFIPFETPKTPALTK